MKLQQLAYGDIITIGTEQEVILDWNYNDDILEELLNKESDDIEELCDNYGNLPVLFPAGTRLIVNDANANEDERSEYWSIEFMILEWPPKDVSKINYKLTISIDALNTIELSKVETFPKKISLDFSPDDDDEDASEDAKKAGDDFSNIAWRPHEPLPKMARILSAEEIAQKKANKKSGKKAR